MPLTTSDILASEQVPVETPTAAKQLTTSDVLEGEQVSEQPQVAQPEADKGIIDTIKDIGAGIAKSARATPRMVSDEQVSEWSKKFNLPEDKVRDYVELKGGIVSNLKDEKDWNKISENIDALSAGVSNPGDNFLATAYAFLKEGGLTDVIKSVPAEASRTVKTALLLPLLMDRGAGSPEEKKFKEFLDSEGQLGTDLVVSRLLTDMAAGVITGTGAVKAVGKLAPGLVAGAEAISPVKSLATRLGAGEKLVNAAKAIDVSGKSVLGQAALGGVAGAVTSKEGEMGQSTLAGIAVGAGIPIFASVATAGVKGMVGTMGLASKLMTKQIADVGGEAIAKVSAREAEEQMLFHVGLSGDREMLPAALPDLEKMANNLEISEKTIQRQMKNEETRNRIGLSKKTEGLAPKQVEMREIEAKKQLIVKRMEDLSERDIRNNEFILDIVEGRRSLPNDLNKLKEISTRLKISPSEIKSYTESDKFRKTLGVVDAVNKAERQKLEAGAINEIILKRFEKINPETVKAERFLYNVSKGDIAFDFTKDNINKYADLLQISKKDISRIAKTEAVSKTTGTKLSISQMNEGDKALLRRESIKDILMRKAETEMHLFADDYAPALIRQKQKAFNLSALIENVDSEENFNKALSAYGNIFPEEIVAQAKLAAASSGGWKAGASVLMKKAEEITASARLAGEFSESRKFMAKVIHDEGNNPDIVFKMFKDYRTYREAIKLGREKAATELVPKAGRLSGIWNAIAPDHIKIDDIERRWEMPDLAITNLKLNNKSQLLDNHRTAFMVKVNKELGDDVSKMIREGNWDGKAFIRYIEDPSLNPAEITDNAVMAQMLPDLARTFRDLDDQVLEEAAALNIRIDKRANHISKIMMNPDKAVAVTQKELNKSQVIQTILETNATPRQFAQAIEQSPEAKAVIEAVEYLTKRVDEDGKLVSMQIKSAADLKTAIRRLQNPKEVIAVSSPMLQFTRSRSEMPTIPDLIRETDPRIIISKNIRNNLTSGYLKDEISTIYKNIQILESIGERAAVGGNVDKLNVAMSDAKQLKRYLSKLLGTDLGVAAEYTTEPLKRKWINHLYKNPNLTEAQIEHALEIPKHVGSVVQNMIYASLLSKPKSWIRNAMQTSLNGSSELGGSVGRDLSAANTGKAALGLLGVDKAKREWYQATKSRLLREGKLSQRQESAEAAEVLGTKGVIAKGKKAVEVISQKKKESGFLAASDTFSELYAKGMLAGFDAMETLNRVATAGMAEDYMAMVKSGRILPKDAFKNVQSKGVESKLRSLVNSGKHEEAQGLLEDYLLQKVQFVYNEANRSNVVKDLGPIFGALLRYPTEAIGGLGGQIKAGKLDAAVEKAFYPLIWLGAAGAYAEKLGDRNERFKAGKEALVGKSNLATMAPVASAAAIGSILPGVPESFGVTASPPLAVKILGEVTGTLMLDDKSAKGLTKDIINLGIPGMPIAEILMDDIYTRLLMGSTKVPVAEGVKEISKAAAAKVRNAKRAVLKTSKKLSK